jgi:hypothetical protein
MRKEDFHRMKSVSANIMNESSSLSFFKSHTKFSDVRLLALMLLSTSQQKQWELFLPFLYFSLHGMYR